MVERFWGEKNFFISKVTKIGQIASATTQPKNRKGKRKRKSGGKTQGRFCYETKWRWALQQTGYTI